MASLGHIAVGMAAARAEGTPGSLTRAMIVWSLLSLLPDADVIGFRFGVAYGHAWGHRGGAHSLLFLSCMALAIALLARAFGQSAWRTGTVASLVLWSHPLLDVLTDGGLGCALLWPFDARRYFAPLRPIPVAPIGAAFFSRAGLHVALVELFMFAPLLAYALWPRKSLARKEESL